MDFRQNSSLGTERPSNWSSMNLNLMLKKPNSIKDMENEKINYVKWSSYYFLKFYFIITYFNYIQTMLLTFVNESSKFNMAMMDFTSNFRNVDVQPLVLL